ncbi:hypothetical protein DLJ54_01230 [Corynebacterium heidelbergense]|uniref:Uncharacterized protein n=2 Tax=Corynebacterium heidelbergense TaxID=2055947 RepID=A0A364V8D2_9CORY|nr:hypothetical protein DLJ54_01230 [Corynebacterium heidelbergense]
MRRSHHEEFAKLYQDAKETIFKAEPELIESVDWKRVAYRDLGDGKSKELYNQHYLTAVFGYYGMNLIPLSYDVRGADFILVQSDMEPKLVQLKSRLTLNRKYLKQPRLYIVFPDKQRKQWFFINHMKLVEIVDQTRISENTVGGSEYIFGDPSILKKNGKPKYDGGWSSADIGKPGSARYEALQPYAIPLPFEYRPGFDPKEDCCPPAQN